MVNQIAETIAKINRQEDFTRRQDYIKQVSEILRIEETGLNALVNKILRDKIAKEESKSFKPGFDDEPPVDSTEVTNEVNDLLFDRDELNERAMIRSLIEFGIKPWDEEKSVAQFLFTEIEENELDKMIGNQLLLSILDLYKQWYQEGKAPTEKNFLYYEDRTISDLIINLMQTDTEISPNWKEKYEGHIPTREELFKEEVFSSLNYLKLRKIKRMMVENQQEMQQATSMDEQILFVQTHQHLKQMEILLTKQLGTVIYK